MSALADRLIDAMAQRSESGLETNAIVMPARLCRELMNDLGPMLAYPVPGCCCVFMGARVLSRAPSLTCRSCGAEAEPGRCSYCGTDSGTIEFLERAPR